MSETLKILGKRRFSFIITALTMIFFYLPIVILIIFSFNNAYRGVIWTGFTLKWYSLLFKDDKIWRAFLNTAIIAITSSTIATVIGVLSAVGIYWHEFKLKKYFQGLIYTPLIIPDILMGVSMLMLFVSLKIPLGLFTIFVAHVTFSIAYVILIVIARLENFDYSIVEAAQDLGANWHQIFFKIVIPMIKPAIIASFLLSITLSIDDFVITFFVAGPGSTTLPLQIYSMIKFGVSPEINALSTLLIVGTLLLSIIGLKFRRLIFS